MLSLLDLVYSPSIAAEIIFCFCIVAEKIQVTEESTLIPRHTVQAVVNVTVKEIPEEAVDKSGSMRLAGITAEMFIQTDKVFNKY